MTKTKKPLTLGEMLARGMEIPSSGPTSDDDFKKLVELTEKQIDVFPIGSIAPVRRPGRPKKEETKTPTKPRSIRMPIALWAQIESIAKNKSTNINTLIETILAEYAENNHNGEETTIPGQTVLSHYDNVTQLIIRQPSLNPNNPMGVKYGYK